MNRGLGVEDDTSVLCRSIAGVDWLYATRRTSAICKRNELMQIQLHPCEKVIGMFFHNQIWSRLLDMNRLCLICIKTSIEEVAKCQISKRVYHQGRSDEILKKAWCQFCDVKFGQRIMEAVVFFDHKMHNLIQITFNFTNRWSQGVISWCSDIILHEWYFRKLYFIK